MPKTTARHAGLPVLPFMPRFHVAVRRGQKTKTARSIVVMADGRVADPVVFTTNNMTWHERVVGGWQGMPSQAATLHVPCAVEES